MDRRAFLALGAATAAAGCGASTESAATSGDDAPAAPAVLRKQTRKLTLVTTWPKNFPGLGEAPERVARAVKAMTGGAIDITVYGGGEVVPALEAFDAVSSGSADMYHGAEYYWQGKAKGFNFYCSVPFGLTASEIAGWFEFGGGQELWDALSAQFGVKAMYCGNTGHQMGGWFKREINGLDDFKGLSVRMPGLGGEVLRGLGAATVTLPGAEIYPALQSGAIEATEWVGPWNDRAFGFHREAKYYYGPGFHEPGSALSLGVNLKVWESFSAEEKAIIESACAQATATSIGEFAYNNARDFRVLIDEEGVQLRDFPDEVWSEVGRVSEQVLADTAASDPTTKAVYDSFAAARRDMSAYASMSDGPYLARRERILSGA